MHVGFRNPRTGEIKEVKVGWSWTLFLWSGFFGLPLFLRRLNTLGFLFLALWVVAIVGPGLIGGDDGQNLSGLMFFIFLGLQIWLGIKGNEMTAKNYLEQGWHFAEPGSENSMFAQGKWGIRIDQATA